MTWDLKRFFEKSEMHLYTKKTNGHGKSVIFNFSGHIAFSSGHIAFPKHSIKLFIHDEIITCIVYQIPDILSLQIIY